MMKLREKLFARGPRGLIGLAKQFKVWIISVIGICLDNGCRQS